MRLPWPFSLLSKRVEKARPEAHRAGAWGEHMAEKHLKALGYRILGRNVRFGPRRELDLVARSPCEKTLVFVEVKTRRSEAYGRPVSAVDRSKRRAIGRAAMSYMRQAKIQPERIRFDVVEVIGRPGGEPPKVRHIENAFSPGLDYRLPW